MRASVLRFSAAEVEALPAAVAVVIVQAAAPSTMLRMVPSPATRQPDRIAV